MTAITGLVGWTDGVALEPSVAAMLETSMVFGRVRQSSRRLGHACFGHALSADLPQDLADQQPLVARASRIMLAADLRIDNRDEIIAALGLDRSSSIRSSDGAIFSAAWERWGEAALDRLLGDMAFAIWDADRGELVLGRTPATTRTLFYHLGAEFAAFASMPDALHRLEAIPKRLNLDELARRLSGGTHFGTVESSFAILKRGLYGTFHSVSEQHLQRYATEFDFRWNHRVALGFNDVQRTTAALKGIEGKRLTYRA